MRCTRDTAHERRRRCRDVFRDHDVDDNSHVLLELREDMITDLDLEFFGELRCEVRRPTSELRIRPVTPQLSFKQKPREFDGSTGADEPAVPQF